MPRRPVPTAPARAELTLVDMRRAIDRFRDLLTQFEEFGPQRIQGARDPQIVEIAAAAKSALERTYPVNSTQYRQLRRLASLEHAVPMYVGRLAPLHEVHDALKRARDECIILLRQAIKDLEEDLRTHEEAAPEPTPAGQASVARAAFIVHGHDEGPREGVARFLMSLGIRPIILHEQANKGRTLIEKFEQEGQVPFAVVLLTPDDVGGTSKDTLRPRARQNVILELGYFIGRLGRGRVCAIKRGDLEEPSDILGVAYVKYDDHGAWRQELAKELDAAGMEVDWNKVMKQA